MLASLGVVAWLGCNDLLGIDEPRFVPYADGGLTADARADAGSAIVTSRRVARVPRGETVHVTIDVNLTGVTGALTTLTLSPLKTGDVTIAQEQSKGTPSRFLLTFTAKPDAAVVDEKLAISAVTDKNEAIGALELRVLVGAPGTYDPTFGANGVVEVEAPVQTTAVVSFGAGTTIVASDNHDVIEVTREGEARLLGTIDVQADCSVTTLAADPSAFFLGGYCGPAGAEKRFVAQADVPHTDTITPDAAVTKVPPIQVPEHDLYVVGRRDDAGWYVSESDSGTGSQLIGRTPALVSAAVPLDFPSALLPADGGFAVLRNDAVESYVARMGGSPFGSVLSFGAGGVASVPVDAGADPEPRLTGAITTSGAVILVTSVDNATPVDDHVYVHAFSPEGALVGSSALDGSEHGTAAADHHDRVIVATETNGDGVVKLHRYLANATADATLPSTTPIMNCKSPLVGVDDDGLILIFCGRADKSTVHRIWP